MLTRYECVYCCSCIVVHPNAYCTGRARTLDGMDCIFPFLYLGVEYHTCTDVDNMGRMWCATTSVVSLSSTSLCCLKFLHMYTRSLYILSTGKQLAGDWYMGILQLFGSDLNPD